jgi:hypothetical protein
MPRSLPFYPHKQTISEPARRIGGWSSTRAHLRGKDDGLAALAPIRDRFLGATGTRHSARPLWGRKKYTHNSGASRCESAKVYLMSTIVKLMHVIPGCAGPESIHPVVVVDSGLARFCSRPGMTAFFLLAV